MRDLKRSTTLHLVPSQFTERIQARHVPQVWPSHDPWYTRAIRWFMCDAPQWVVEAVVYGFVVLAAMAFAMWVTS